MNQRIQTQHHSIQLNQNNNRNNSNNIRNKLTNHLITPIKTILSLYLHLLFHIIQFYLIKPTPIHISHSSTPTNSFYLPIKPNNNNNNNPSNNNSSAILITNNSDLNPLTLQLALNFAAIGYHVFLQVSSQSQLTQLIIRWQRVKSKLNKSLNNRPQQQPQPFLLTRIFRQLFSCSTQPHPPQHPRPIVGTIIPLLYLTPDVPQRLEAISTITAYVYENDIDMISLINIIDPYRIRKCYPTSHSPTSPTFGLRSSQFNPTAPAPHSTSPSASSTRPLTGTTSPTGSDRSNNLCSPPTPRAIPVAPSNSVNYELYSPHPLPLSISSDVYLFDALGDTLLGPLSTIQDLLLLLKNHRGRVINIWNGHRYPQTGLANILLDGFQKTNQVLKVELDKLQIPVSIVYAPTEQSSCNFAKNHSAQRIVTQDSRSLLSEASDSELLAIFIQQMIEEMKKEEDNSNIMITSDLITSFNLVRLVLETNYPSDVYPIGLKQIIDQIAHLSGFNHIYAGFDYVVKFLN